MGLHDAGLEGVLKPKMAAPLRHLDGLLFIILLIMKEVTLTRWFCVFDVELAKSACWIAVCAACVDVKQHFFVQKTTPMSNFCYKMT